MDIRGLYTRGTCIRNRTGGWQPTERLWIYLRTGQAARHVTQFHYPCWLACAAMPTIFLSLSSSNLPSEFRHEYTHGRIVSFRTTLSYYICIYVYIPRSLLKIREIIFIREIIYAFVEYKPFVVACFLSILLASRSIFIHVFLSLLLTTESGNIWRAIFVRKEVKLIN